MKKVHKDKMKTEQREQPILPVEQGEHHKHFQMVEVCTCSQSRQVGRKEAFEADGAKT